MQNSMPVCPHCGNQISANTQFCKTCGKSLAAKPADAPLQAAPSTPPRLVVRPTAAPPRKGRFSPVLIGLSACICIACICVAVISMGGAGVFLWNKANLTEFTLGPIQTYAVSAAKDTRITDSVTGQTIRFPDGGSGNVQIANIKSGPAAPFDGHGVHIEYQGNTPIQLMLEDPGADTSVVVMGYGYLPGTYVANRWFALPEGQVVDGQITVGLAMPFELPVSWKYSQIASLDPGFGLGGRAFASQAPKAPKPGAVDYWISEVAGKKDIEEQKDDIQKQVYANADKMLDTLPEGIKESASDDRKRLSPVEIDPYVYGKGKNLIFEDKTTTGTPSYTGFGLEAQIAGHGYKNPKPWIHIHPKDPTLAQSLAHETGHYITHILVGDDNYRTLQGQSPILWNTNHGIGTPLSGRQSFYLEEPAYFAEYFLTGQVGSLSPSDIRRTEIANKADPQFSDLPAVEGFGFLMLQSLTEKQPMLEPPIYKTKTQSPVVKATYGEVFEIISKGATGIDDLIKHIDAFLVKKEGNAFKLPVIAERNGWRYMVKGRLLNYMGGPIEGATIESIARVGCTDYQTGRVAAGLTDKPTDADGKFYLANVFPGDSLLRVTLSPGSKFQQIYDLPIGLGWKEPTNKEINLGDLKLPGLTMEPKEIKNAKPAEKLTFTATASNIPFTTRKLQWDWYALDVFEDSTHITSADIQTDTLDMEFPTSVMSTDVQVDLLDASCGTTTILGHGEVRVSFAEEPGAPEGESQYEATPRASMTPTLAPVKTPTLVPVPTETPTTAPTETPASTSCTTLRGTVNQVANCRYGPGAPYLYKYGVNSNTKMEIIGRDADGNWLNVQGIGGHNACWVKADLMQVDSDVMCLPDNYPPTRKMTISPFFEQITILGASNDGGSVTVDWLEHIIRSDLVQEGVVEYIVEVWTCVDGKPNFSAIGTNETSASFQIDSSCGFTSFADVIGQDKEGFSFPAVIPLP